MNILVIGEQQNLDECNAKFGAEHRYTLVAEHREAEKFVQNDTLIFDFSISEDPLKIDIYAGKNALVFLNTVKVSLAELLHRTISPIRATVFGFNGLPTFVNRELVEVSLLHKEDREMLEQICAQLNTNFSVVEDRVGLVTPRIICMIINEAYFTVQEGTASREDIDKAMKLGTNYPYGPFEWCTRIGIHHVYEVLHAVYEDTKDERYKICPLLKTEYLRYEAKNPV